ncbi:TetR/AcrR family transcriptional regulator [Acidimangrovimonas sediminis]|uniref:TetR/AcrR family transcriptional regulator n=1 Tax=Acidimangrovimonas sediminis TaxID=2056283 RepID=UPI000C80E19B|nr:TetR/AcrR family transcriptional regulator [Acidimangrovimonas sediminis]
MKSDEPDDLLRKKPVQDRSRQTMETILQAAAQILRGGERLTTEALARRAGYSVGTLYQYFPSREAVVLSLIERQRAEVNRRLKQIAAAPAEADPRIKTRLVVAELCRAFRLHHGTDRRHLRALLRATVERGLPEPGPVIPEVLIAIWSEAAGPGTAPPELSQTERAVLARAVIEPLRQAALSPAPEIAEPAFEAALVRLISGFMTERG